MKRINHQRQELVVKSNDFIRKTRYKLSEREQKILIYIIAQIDKNSDNIKQIDIDIKKFCKVCGITNQTNNKNDIFTIIQNIADKSEWYKVGDKKILFRWIDTVSIDKSVITVSLSESIKPYLIELSENFTKYELINVLVLHSKYSIRLYELFKSYLWLKGFEIELEELKDIINCNSYKLYKDFNKNILKRTVNEINNYTDLTVSYSTIKDGKKVVAIKFKIIQKKGVQITWDSLINQYERLEQ